MSDEHPSYPNPTIVEALCEVHFRLPGGWEPSLAGELFKRIQDEYPEMEPMSEVSVQLEHGPAGVLQRIEPARQKTRFKHADRPLLIHLAENMLTVNVLKPYPGWATMRSDVLSGWRHCREVLEPESVQRVGLRYINRIPRESLDQRPCDWLKASDYVPPAVLESRPGFFLRAQTHLDATNSLIVTLADARGDATGDPGGIVFDIDRIVEQDMGSDCQVIEDEIERLHTEVWRVFSSAKGPSLERLLRGEG